MAGTDPKLPETEAEWQDAVDTAHGLLAIDAARAYGLIKGGPHPNIDRCEEILALGSEKGVTPRKDAVESTVKLMSHP